MILKDINSNDEITHVALSGRLDISGVQEVELKFTEKVASKGNSAIIDISEVSFLASLGMRMFLSSAKALKNHGAKFILLSPRPLVAEALETAGFGAVMEIENDLDSAFEKIKND